MRDRRFVIVAAACFWASTAEPESLVHWPQFRGADGAGIADSSVLPTRWSATDNVAWTAELPGRGWSSPIVWGDRVYVTTALNAGGFKAASTGIYGNDYAAELKKQGLSDDEILKRVVNRDIELASESEDVSYEVVALDARTGKVVWQREAHRGKPSGGRHRKNTYASETPATDGERVYASFGGNVGLFCYSREGTLVWKQTWAPQPIYLDFGTASSPVVHGGRVYQLHDNEGESFLVALDGKTGTPAWKVSRTANEGRLKSGWATPFVWSNGLRTEIVTVGRGLVISYDTEGRELWRLKGITQATPTPVAGEGLLFVGSGSQGENSRPLFAIQPGAKGDISTAEGAPRSEFVSWFLPRFSAYTSSPLLYRGRVYAVNDNGVLQVADARTGAEIYKARVGGGGATFSSSPLASAGRIYLLSEDGDTFVLEAGDEYKELAKNSMGEMSLASPAADASGLYVRTLTKLYRLQAPPPSAPATAAAAPANPFQITPEERARLDQLAREDHADMMRQLGITKLRPGANGRAAAGEPGAANYDPALANPYPDWPDALTLKDGGKVTSADTWWQKRRPELALDFEREVYGRVPQNVPKVWWTVAETVETTVGGQPVVARRVIGHADNSAHPAIAVDIKMAVVLPVNAKGPVPVLMMFGGGHMPGEAPPRFPGAQEPAAPPSNEQLIAAGWGYVSLSTASIQADNGAGLTAGIVGLTNKGQRRTPEQWGSLRAWGWGAARALDYLETLPAVDAKRVGAEGVSRYGKAALVTMAFEPRFALVLVGSSGEGGAKPHRRNFGEQVENLTGSGQYHWMAGNFLKFGAAEASFGSKNAGDIPVDAHQLIALCAPRPTFISYGVPEKGDANWLDQQGSYMATVAAGPVFRLLGARDIGVSEDYRAAKLPPVNTGLLDGELAWRQHDGGHEDRSNMSFFIGWANRLLQHTPPPVPAHQPQVRADRNSHLAHQQLLAKAKSGGIDVYFVGDSITRRWGALDYPDFLAHWNASFHGWNAGNFGWGADRTENILWRLDNGELDGVNPKVIVILAGTNNVGREPGDDGKVADVTRGLSAIVAACQKKAPAATIVLTAIFPRNDNPAVMPTIDRINANLATMADGRSVRFLDVNSKLADAKGMLLEGLTVDGLHPSLKGYEVWAASLQPILTELLGPPADTDHAPPPTGDPSATPKGR